jgi:predicted nucleic-acid-binding protein
MSIAIDTHVLVRLLVRDDEAQSPPRSARWTRPLRPKSRC